MMILYKGKHTPQGSNTVHNLILFTKNNSYDLEFTEDKFTLEKNEFNQAIILSLKQYAASKGMYLDQEPLEYIYSVITNDTIILAAKSGHSHVWTLFQIKIILNGIKHKYEVSNIYKLKRKPEKAPK